MNDTIPEGDGTSVLRTPTRVHTATRVKIAETMRLVSEGWAVDLACKQTKLPKSTYYRLRPEFDRLASPGLRSPSAKLKELMYHYGKTISNLATAFPECSLSSYVMTCNMNGMHVTRQDVKLVLEHLGIDNPELRKMKVLSLLKSWQPQTKGFITDLVKLRNTLPVMLAEAIPGRRMVVVDLARIPPSLDGRKDIYLLQQYDPMRFRLSLRTATTKPLDTRLQVLRSLVPDKVTVDEIEFLCPSGTVAGRTFCTDEKLDENIIRHFSMSEYPLRLSPPGHSLASRVLVELSAVSQQWVFSELHALRVKHPREGIDILVAEVERRWNETKRISRGDRILCPSEIAHFRMMATQLAWRCRHRIEGGINSAVQLDLLLSLGEQLLIHVKPEVWIQKCVGMIQHCGNNPQSKGLFLGNLGLLLVTAAALVHPDCRKKLPRITGSPLFSGTEYEYARSLLAAARSQGYLEDLYITEFVEWLSSAFDPKDYRDKFQLTPQTEESTPPAGESQKS